MIPVLMTLTLTQGHMTAQKLEVAQSFSLELQKATQMFIMLDYITEMASKKPCKYDD